MQVTLTGEVQPGPNVSPWAWYAVRIPDHDNKKTKTVPGNEYTIDKRANVFGSTWNGSMTTLEYFQTSWSSEVK